MRPFRPPHMLLSTFCAIFSTAFTMWIAYNEVSPISFPKVVFITLGVVTELYTFFNVVSCFHAMSEPWVYELRDED